MPQPHPLSHNHPSCPIPHPISPSPPSAPGLVSLPLFFFHPLTIQLQPPSPIIPNPPSLSPFYSFPFNYLRPQTSPPPLQYLFLPLLFPKTVSFTPGQPLPDPATPSPCSPIQPLLYNAAHSSPQFRPFQTLSPIKTFPTEHHTQPPFTPFTHHPSP